jgi:hypothetical protein
VTLRDNNVSPESVERCQRPGRRRGDRIVASAGDGRVSRATGPTRSATKEGERIVAILAGASGR